MKLYKVWIGAVLSLFVLVGVNAQPIKNAEVSFKIKNAGLNVGGSLQGFEGDISFDSKDLLNSKIAASVQVKTIDTGIGMRDKHLKKDDYFDVEQHPKITMESISFSAKGENKYEGQFQLTIKGHTEEVTIPFTIEQNGSTRTFNGDFKINRRDYGVGGNSFILSDKVNVFIKVETELP